MISKFCKRIAGSVSHLFDLSTKNSHFLTLSELYIFTIILFQHYRRGDYCTYALHGREVLQLVEYAGFEMQTKRPTSRHKGQFRLETCWKSSFEQRLQHPPYLLSDSREKLHDHREEGQYPTE